ncbi:hypothetical protein AOQ84DRAFT_392084 [Glonium stellatum]|uniref:DUF7730 domain-containing protein n=1 Tax=Glonium stellatum TaxID=574774 RepID=A0A8E2ERS7_9PEZI|nr:hypothetical protein AOQ84DRAFT_392084 [Glonium stellatum]
MQSQSPLLDLPAELRNRIYEFVLGGELLHVYRSSYRDTGFHITICQSQSAEANSYKRFMDPSIDERAKITSKYTRKVSLQNYFTVGDEYYVDPCSSRHTRGECYNAGNPSLDLSLLRVCKQIYYEARLVPYSTNAFGFQSADTFNIFISTLTPPKRSALEKLHLTRNIPNTGPNQIKPPDPPLTGLKSLHLSLENIPNYSSKASLVEPKNTDIWITDILLLDRRLLKTVTVIFSDHPSVVRDFKKRFQLIDVPSSVQYLDDWLEEREHRFLTVNQKRDIAERIRIRLLKP